MDSKLYKQAKKVLPTLLSLLICIFFYLTKFSQSMKSGKAGWEPLYDDISYINDGMKRFFQFQSNPFPAILDFIISPPAVTHLWIVNDVNGLGWRFEPKDGWSKIKIQ